MDTLDRELYEFIKFRYFKKFKEDTFEEFEKYLDLYLKLPPFRANQNIHEITTDYKDRNSINSLEDEYVDRNTILFEDYFDEDDSFNFRIHWILRIATQYYITKAFEAMKINLEDPNIEESSLGKGTPGRISKLWVGDNPEDTSELGSGRFNKEPYISYFPSNGCKSVITKEVDLVATCSHHFLPFSSLDGGKITISYIPGNYLIGISKLQRYVNWCARRFWLQEDLTTYIGEQIKRISGTEDVYIKCEGLVHGCEKFRGANSKNGNLTSEYRSGVFLHK